MKNCITVDDIELNVEAEDWRDAVRKTGSILVRNGRVEDSYVEDMVETVESLGPYIVVCPGLAIPHAKKGKKVLKSGIGIVTLKKPVCFGNSSNDPVKVLIGLAGANDDVHLDIMQAIVSVFEDDTMVDVIANSHDRKWIANLFNQKGEVK